MEHFVYYIDLESGLLTRLFFFIAILYFVYNILWCYELKLRKPVHRSYYVKSYKEVLKCKGAQWIEYEIIDTIDYTNFSIKMKYKMDGDENVDIVLISSTQKPNVIYTGKNHDKQNSVFS